MTPKPLLQPLLKELNQTYQFAIDHGLKTLKIQFLQKHHQHKLGFGLRRLEIRLVTDILSPPLNKKLRNRLAKTIGAPPAQLSRIRKEVPLILKGQRDQLIALRSPHELHQRARGPFFETEAYFYYLNWLEEGKFPISIPEPTLWQTHLTPLEWIGSKEQLHRLYHLLIEDQWIGKNLDLAGFCAHFQRTTSVSALITWKSTNMLLLYLFDQLIHYQFIPDHHRTYLASLLPLHFLDRKNRPLKTKSLTVSRSKSFKAPRHAERIDWLIEELLKK